MPQALRSAVPAGLIGPGALCGADSALLEGVRDKAGLRRTALGAGLWMVAGSAVYGSVFGWWRSPEQALYSALKMPILFSAIVVSSSLVNGMLAQVLGGRISLAKTLTLILTGMAVTAILLASLSPVALFFVLQAPSPSPEALFLPASHPAVRETMRTYWVILLGHVGLVGAAGIAGNLKIYRLLCEHTSRRDIALRILLAWLAVIGFVGCELSWLCSPFLCKPTQMPHVFPKEYFQQNFYERVWQALGEMTTRE